ncbi:hypothetical protein [Mycobacteroides abscessus]|uniref:hypothetical protein n=1 Tax=Mycobacteroides abscessus TaxID=36809 RepID=UPI0009D14F15|nr:hypothetical protein [Mycobacteroides abscessus]MBE5481576.1 hypothetical protein [Mycobacteroides abscessus]MDB2206201.1 hypothetical protein [Mycobacteroides abscessus subsp. massiliense]MDB2208946.1 hypothetical protein [Mycobacteroides abscessus subsp. massiliense]MDB2227548.1 hypothetical protein [Mycobacteroides abscessus subsp. abscessus]MDB2231873.1 hypothetical protein [Mycobacteroides abscessus subsp. massiliense]
MRRGDYKKPASSPKGVPLDLWTRWTVAQRYAYIEGKRDGLPGLGGATDDKTVYSFKPVGAWPRGLVGPSGFVTGARAASGLVCAYARKYGYTATECEGVWELTAGQLVGKLRVYAVQ